MSSFLSKVGMGGEGGKKESIYNYDISLLFPSAYKILTEATTPFYPNFSTG